MTKASRTREEEGDRYYAYFREELFSRLGGEPTEARRATTTWQATGTPPQRGESRWNVKDRRTRWPRFARRISFATVSHSRRRAEGCRLPQRLDCSDRAVLRGRVTYARSQSVPDARPNSHHP
jgi:hypothetical protein